MNLFPNMVGKSNVIGTDDADEHDDQADDAESFWEIADRKKKNGGTFHRKLNILPSEKHGMQEKRHERERPDDLMKFIRLAKIAEDFFLGRNANSQEKCEGKRRETEYAKNFAKVRDGCDWRLVNEPKSKGERKKKCHGKCAFWKRHICQKYSG